MKAGPKVFARLVCAAAWSLAIVRRFLRAQVDAAMQRRRLPFGARPLAATGAGLKEARLSTRLLVLPKEELAKLACAALLQPGYLATAEHMLATITALPEWAVSSVLLSPDLVASILAHLGEEDGTIAAVCKLWYDKWKATAEYRRGLRPATTISLPDTRIQGQPTCLKAFACWESNLQQSGLLCVLARTDARTVPGGPFLTSLKMFDANLACMDECMASEIGFHPTGIAAGLSPVFENIFLWNDQELRCYNVAIQPPDCPLFLQLAQPLPPAGTPQSLHGRNCTVVTPGGLHFLAAADQRPLSGPPLSGPPVVVYDPVTLAYKYSWGMGHLQFPTDLTVVDETIYVLDIVERGLKSEHSRLQVFSFDGGFRRTVSGPDLCNLRPSFLEYYNGRLYAIERGCVSCAGQCERSCHNGNVGVCVLTPDGTTLQIYDPQWGRCTNVCIFERKLLLCGHGYEGEQAASSSRASPASSILEGELVEVLCGL